VFRYAFYIDFGIHFDIHCGIVPCLVVSVLGFVVILLGFVVLGLGFVVLGLGIVSDTTPPPVTASGPGFTLLGLGSTLA